LNAIFAAELDKTPFFGNNLPFSWSIRLNGINLQGFQHFFIEAELNKRLIFLKLVVLLFDIFDSLP
jgi:hypothetical protein